MGKLYEESWYQKWQKEANMGKFQKLYRYRYKAVPVHPQQKPSCTGTPQQNATCTGTGQRCTGIGVPKMPRMLYFHILSLNSCTVSMGTLLNDYDRFK